MAACAGAAAHFKIGDSVSVLRHGKATIVSEFVEDPSNERYGRYQVQYLEDGSTYWVLPCQHCIFPKPPARVLVAETTKHYRSAAMLYTHPDDVVLEVGCHEGVTTDILHRRCKWVVGIDIAEDPLNRAKARYPHVRFEQIDGFDTEQLKALSPTGRYDKIFIDIGGIADLHVVMGLVGLYFSIFRKATLVVKNRYFKGLLGHAQVYVPHNIVDDRQKAAARKQQQQQQQQKGREKSPGKPGKQQQHGPEPSQQTPSTQQQQQQEEEQQEEEKQEEEQQQQPPPEQLTSCSANSVLGP